MVTVSWRQPVLKKFEIFVNTTVTIDKKHVKKSEAGVVHSVPCLHCPIFGNLGLALNEEISLLNSDH